MSNPVQYPRSYRATPLTINGNQMIKRAGAELTRLARENTDLHVKLSEVQTRAAEIEARQNLTDIALEAVERGVIKASSVRTSVDAWVREGRSPETARAVLFAGSSLGFGSTEGASLKTSSAPASQGLDKTAEDRQADFNKGLESLARRSR